MGMDFKMYKIKKNNPNEKEIIRIRRSIDLLFLE